MRCEHYPDVIASFPLGPIQHDNRHGAALPLLPV